MNNEDTERAFKESERWFIVDPDKIRLTGQIKEVLEIQDVNFVHGMVQVCVDNDNNQEHIYWVPIDHMCPRYQLDERIRVILAYREFQNQAEREHLILNKFVTDTMLDLMVNYGKKKGD